MKLKSYNLLFRLFSFLSDKTNGAPFFVKYKLILGTLILGVVSSAKAKAQNNEVVLDDIDTVEIMCYEPTAPSQKQPMDKITVRGIVKDKTKEPLAGVTVLIKGTTTSAITDLNGSFSITGKPDETLVFSFVGYNSREIAIAELKNDTVVTMDDDGVELSCYIVIEPDYLRKIEIQGVVRDKDGFVLPGVIVRVKDSATVHITDVEGRFRINAGKRDRLLFSIIGLEQKEVPVSQMRGKDNTVILSEESFILCYDVVVVKNYTDDVYRRFSRPKKITKLSYNEIETPPVSPVGDVDAFQDWMQRTIRYTEQMRKEKTEGEVILSFAVDKKGKVVDMKVTGKLSKEADAEALRVLASSDRWTPGMQNKKPIKTTMMVSLYFKDGR